MAELHCQLKRTVLRWWTPPWWNIPRWLSVPGSSPTTSPLTRIVGQVKPWFLLGKATCCPVIAEGMWSIQIWMYSVHQSDVSRIQSKLKPAGLQCSLTPRKNNFVIKRCLEISVLFELGQTFNNNTCQEIYVMMMKFMSSLLSIKQRQDNALVAALHNTTSRSRQPIRKLFAQATNRNFSRLS